MSVWQVAHQYGTTAVRVGDQVRFPDAPDELWEVSGPPVEMIESDYGDGECPSFPCKQLEGDMTRYSADRKANSEIDMCGDAVAEALYRQATPDAGAGRREEGTGERRRHG